MENGIKIWFAYSKYKIILRCFHDALSEFLSPITVREIWYWGKKFKVPKSALLLSSLYMKIARQTKFGFMFLSIDALFHKL